MAKFDDTHAKKILDIFNEYNQVIVPQFQRDYSWDTTTGKSAQVSELWNDLSEKYEEWLDDDDADIEYLLGPMVFIKNKTDNTLEIVDGQQRLATLTMILSIIRDVYHELECDISSYDFDDEKISEIYELVERRKQNNDETFSHLNWKLDLNSNDKEYFSKYVQRYKTKPFGEEIAQPGDKFVKITDKIKFLKKELKRKDAKLRPSWKKIINAYLFLHEQIEDALFTQFGRLDKSELIDIEIKRKVEKQVDEKLRSNPGGVGLPREFFNAPVDGLDTFINELWDDDEKKLIQGKYDLYCKKVKTAKDFTTWKKLEINKIKNQNYNDVSYSSIHNEECEKLIHIEKLSYQKKNMSKLLHFAKFLIQKKLFSVRIIVENDDDAYQIFETINARGEPLSKSSLLKNYVLRQIISKDDKNEYSKKWDNILNSLSKSNSSPDTFLRESLISRGSKDPDTGKFVFKTFPIQTSHKKRVKVSKDNLYKVLKYNYEILDNANEKDDYAKYYIDKILLDDLDLSNLLDDPINNLEKKLNSKSNDPRPALIDLMNLEAKYIRLPIICAYRQWTPESTEFIVLVKFLVPFFFRYKTICDKNTSKLESLMYEICSKIKNGTDKKNDLMVIIKYLLQFNNDDEFENSFLRRLDDPDSTLSKFILQHIETQLGSPYDDVEAIANLQLEHVLPQSPLTKGKNPTELWIESDFIKNYDSKIHQSLSRFSSWHGKIGNLTLLKDQINTSIKNKNFLTKRDFMDSNGTEKGYRSSLLKINIETVVKTEKTGSERQTWTVKSIHERGVYFKELAQNIWDLPKIICSNSSCKFYEGHKLDGLEIDEVEETKCSKCNSKLELKLSTNQTGQEYKIPTDFF